MALVQWCSGFVFAFLLRLLRRPSNNEDTEQSGVLLRMLRALRRLSNTENTEHTSI